MNRLVMACVASLLGGCVAFGYGVDRGADAAGTADPGSDGNETGTDGGGAGQPLDGGEDATAAPLDGGLDDGGPGSSDAGADAGDGSTPTCDPTAIDGSAVCEDLCPPGSPKLMPGLCGCQTLDDDSDGDGTPDCVDACALNPAKTEPGVCGCATADEDADGNGTLDCLQECPGDSSKPFPGECGCGTPDTDADGDGTADCNDGCPSDGTKLSAGACGCGTPDDDSDSDGTADCNDGCTNDSSKTTPGTCGCGTPDDDGDSDGTPDCNDGCPADGSKTSAGACGCGTPDTDGDGDGTPDCNDGCPTDSGKTAPGGCTCGTPDTDSDSDGTLDCNDACPNDPNKASPGACDCGNPDVDSDNDGTLDCNDGCPADPLKTTPGTCGCGTPEGCGADLCPDNPNKVVPGDCGCATPDTDSDGDGTADCVDECPTDTDKVLPDGCGCGFADLDLDGDGTLDCYQACGASEIYVAVSPSGAIGYAPAPGTTWYASDNSDTWTTLHDVDGGLGRFIAVGSNALMLRSEDGMSWTPVLNPVNNPTANFHDVLYAGAGVWAVAGDDGSGSRVWFSYDHGDSWTNGGSPFGPSVRVHGLALDPATARWVAAGGRAEPLLAYATRTPRSGMSSWTQASFPTPPGGAGPMPLHAVEFDRGERWIAAGPGGYTLLSTDQGMTWRWSAQVCGGADIFAIEAWSMGVSVVGDQACVSALFFGANPDNGWIDSAIMLPRRPALRAAHYDCGAQRFFVSADDGRVSSTSTADVANLAWQPDSTMDAFTSRDSLDGIAGHPQGPVRVEFSMGDGEVCTSPPPYSLSSPADDTVYVRSVNFRTPPGGNPVIAGVPISGNSVTMRLRAGVMLETPGKYEFQVAVGPESQARLMMGGEVALAHCLATGSTASLQVDVPAPSNPGEPAYLAFDLTFQDKSGSASLILRYRGPGTTTPFEVVPEEMFVRSQ